MTLRGFIIRVGRGLVDKSGHLFKENLFPIETEKKQARFVEFGSSYHYPQKRPPTEKRVKPAKQSVNCPTSSN